MEIIKLKIEDLTPYENNAKEHPKEQIEQIKNSIEKFGFCDPIGVWGEKNIIIEGHGRLLALREMGVKEVDCIRLDHLTDEERKAYTLAHNKTTLSSDFDFEMLEKELSYLENVGIDMTEFGFESEIIDELKEIEEDEVPEVDEEAEPICQSGDIWQLGRHRLICGDSTDKTTIDLLMDGAIADMILTDPPYNVNVEGGTGLTIQNDNMDDLHFYEFLKSAFTAADSVLKEGGAFYIWHADSEGYNFRSACKYVGWQVRQCLIWSKNNIVLGRQDYQWKHEPCLYGWKDGAAHYFVDDRTQATVIEEDKPLKNAEHPTMKPINLFARLIKNSSTKHDIVLDTFGGSGTTMIACEQLDRTCYMAELDPKYCDVIIKRWETLTGCDAVRISGKNTHNLTV